MTVRPWALLRALLAVAVVALAVAPAASAILVPIRPSAPQPPGAGYTWAQPGTASHAAPSAQPPAWIQTAVVPPAPPTASYTWAQPGTANHAPLAQPPAWVPAG